MPAPRTRKLLALTVSRNSNGDLVVEIDFSPRIILSRRALRLTMVIVAAAIAGGNLSKIVEWLANILTLLG